MKVIGWISYSEIEEGFEESFGGLGGFFHNGMRFNDYITSFVDDVHDYIYALRVEIVKCGIMKNGYQHQNEEFGVPVFSDGTYACFSFRGWGDLMAAIWSEERGRDYSYMDFYC